MLKQEASENQHKRRKTSTFSKINPDFPEAWKGCKPVVDNSLNVLSLEK